MISLIDEYCPPVFEKYLTKENIEDLKSMYIYYYEGFNDISEQSNGNSGSFGNRIFVCLFKRSWS